MGNPAGVRRDFQALGHRRLRAARLLAKTIHQSEVARRVGVHRQSVSRWAQPLEAEGWHGLKKAGRAGRRPRLSAEDLKKIERGLKRGPEALGYETGLWTAWRVAHLIEEECGVRYQTRRLGAFCGNWVGVARVRLDGLWSGERYADVTAATRDQCRFRPSAFCCSKEEREKDRLLPFCCV
jgi:transposase